VAFCYTELSVSRGKVLLLGSRRDVEGARTRTRSPGSSYPSSWQLSRAKSRGYPEETEEVETDVVGCRAQEDFARPEGAMGKDKADGGTDESAHDEPSWTQ
jgi:hypothetical protein